MNKMKTIIIKWSLCLIASLIMSPIVMKVLDIIFKLNLDNFIVIGLKVGVVAWFMLIIGSLFSYLNNRQQPDNDAKTATD